MPAIAYRPTLDNGIVVSDGAILACADPDSVRHALEQAFGPFPLDLSADSRDMLDIAGHGHPSEPAFRELIQAIDSHRTVRVLSA